MAGFVPAIYDIGIAGVFKAWMPGTRLGMTLKCLR
jgi:hypothetical protein